MTTAFTWRLPLLGLDTGPHEVGDPTCPACCHAPTEPHCGDCGGILHSDCDDEVWAGTDYEFVHSYRCDRPCTCPYCPTT